MKTLLALLLTLLVILPTHAQDTVITPENARDLVEVARISSEASGQLGDTPFWSPDGSILAYGGYPGAWFFDPDDLAAPPRLIDVNAVVTDIAWSSDGETFALGGRNHVSLHSLRTDEVRDFPGSAPIAFSPDGTQIASTFGASIMLRSVTDGSFINGLRTDAVAQIGYYLDLMFSPDGVRLYALYNESGFGCVDGYSVDRALVWNLETASNQPTWKDPLLEASGNQITTPLQFSEQAGRVAVDQVVIDTTTLDTIWSAEDAAWYPVGIALSDDGERVAYLDDEFKTQLISVDDGRQIAETDVTGELDFEPSGERIAVGQMLWSPSSNTLSQMRLDEVHVEGGHIVILTRDNRLRVIDPLTQVALLDVQLSLDLQQLDQSFVSATTLVTVGTPVMGDPTEPVITQIWSLETGEQLREISANVTSIDVSPASPLMILYENSRVVAIIDGATNADVPTISLDDDLRPRFLPDGRLVYLSNNQETSQIAIYDPVSNRTRFILEDVDATSWSFYVSPDGRHIVVANRQSDNMMVWDMEANTRLSDIPDARNTTIVFHPDLPLIAYTHAGQGRDFVTVWNIAQGRVVATLDAEQSLYATPPQFVDDVLILEDGSCPVETYSWNYVTNQLDERVPRLPLWFSAISPDGRIGLVKHLDGFALYDTSSDTELVRIPEPDPSVGWMAFTHDGSAILTMLMDRSVLVWQVC